MTEDKATADPDYHKNYYREHRQSIADSKKERYENDPEYRRSILQRAREKRAKDRKARMEAKAKQKRKDPMAPVVFSVYIGGEDRMVNMYSVTQLGLALDRKAQTIRIWEKKGILPKAIYRSTSGDRLYTELQVKLLASVFSGVIREYGKLAFTRISRTNFSKLAREIWSQYPQGIEE
jgi:hypothetical protein